MIMETQPISPYVTRSKYEKKMATLKHRTRSGRFRFKITVDGVQKWAIFDKATWDLMKHEVLTAIEGSKFWKLEDMTN